MNRFVVFEARTDENGKRTGFLAKSSFDTLDSNTLAALAVLPATSYVEDQHASKWGGSKVAVVWETREGTEVHAL